MLNGEPFIRHHIDVFRQLKIPWSWHVIEGLAAHVKDTAWGAKRGGGLPEEFKVSGRSTDGTTDYLDSVAAANPGQVRLYRKPLGSVWEGKLEMVSAPMKDIQESGLLWQIDADELWSVEQIEQAHALFLREPSRSAAWFECHFFVAPEFCSSELNVYGNFCRSEWLRVWRYQPGDYWDAHEPPTLLRSAPGQGSADVGRLHPLTHEQTAREGLRFQHYAYATEQQVQFKERYYGYPGAVQAWRKLQVAAGDAPRLRRYLPWVREAEIGTAHTPRTAWRTMTEPWQPASRARAARRRGVTPLAQRDCDGNWSFHSHRPAPGSAPHVVVVRADRIGDHLLSFGLLGELRKAWPCARLTLACPNDAVALIPDRSILNEIVGFERDRAHAEARYRRQILAEIQRVPVDLVLCPQYNRDNLVNKLSVAIQAPRRVGFDSQPLVARPSHLRKYRKYARGFDVLIRGLERDRPELQKYQQFLRGLDISSFPSVPHFKPSLEDCERAEALLRQHGLLDRPRLSIFPGAANSVRNLQQLGAALRQVPELAGLAIIGLGSAEHRQLIEQSINDSGMDGVNLAGQTSLPVAAALLQGSRLAIGTDTGLAHLACAVGCRNVVILGGGDFGRFFPYSPLTNAVALPLSCYFCHYECRFATAHCLNSIPAGTVRAAIAHALANSPSKPQLFVPKGETLPSEVAGLRASTESLRSSALAQMNCELHEVETKS